MKILKRKNMLSKKNLSIIIAGIVIVTGTVYFGGSNYKANKLEGEFQTRERVYTVERGTITAGVKGAGTLKFEAVKHNFDESVVLGEIFVSEGQSVKSGDKLVSISEKYLNDKLEELNKSLNQANLVLDQAKGDKESALLSNDKSWNEKLQASQNQYESQKREINDSISNLSSKLAGVKAKIDEVRNQIAELLGNSDENNNLIEELRAKEEAALSEQSLLQEELDSINKRLSNLEADRENQLQTEANEADSNNEINNIRLNSLNTAISNAQDEVNNIQEEINKINKLKETPILYAKTDGIVNKINNTDGTPTSITVSIVEIGESSKVTAEITISQNDIINIEEGQEVKLEISTYQDEKFTGKVKVLNLKPNSQGNSTTYSATVELDETDYKLLEGMTATAQFIIKEVKDVVMISNKAIVLKEGKQFVKLKNEDESITEVEIQTGFSDGKSTEIITGLNEGDTVVVGGE